MRLSLLSSWWTERQQARTRRRALDATRGDELWALIDEASSFERHRH